MTPDEVSRFWAKVHATGDCWLWTGARDMSGYGYMYLGSGHANRSRDFAHRLSYRIHHGPIPAGMHVDHICHVLTCVTPGHLRLATPKQNGENRLGPNRNGTSGVRGVSWDKARGKWRAQVKHHRVNHLAGRFNTIEDATAAVVALRRTLFTHNDHDNEATT
jgi:hypothetical protein